MNEQDLEVGEEGHVAYTSIPSNELKSEIFEEINKSEEIAESFSKEITYLTEILGCVLMNIEDIEQINVESDCRSDLGNKLAKLNYINKGNLLQIKSLIKRIAL